MKSLLACCIGWSLAFVVLARDNTTTCVAAFVVIAATLGWIYANRAPAKTWSRHE